MNPGYPGCPNNLDCFISIALSLSWQAEFFIFVIFLGELNIIMKNILIVIAFLTRIPVKINFSFGEEELGKTARYFPLVGLLLGLLVAGVVYVFGFIDVQLGAVMGIITGIALTGGLHLDGAMDTADGIFSARTPERMLEIMKDSRVGAHGVTTAVILLLFKFVLYQNIWQSGKIFWAIPMAFIISRWLMVLAILYFPGARPNGLGHIFVKYKRPADFPIATVIALAPVVIFAQWISFIPIVTVFGFSWIFCTYLRHVLGGLTGDTYGALTELSEVVYLLATVGCDIIFELF